MEELIVAKSTSKQRSHFNFPEITYWNFFSIWEPVTVREVLNQ
jgi:hypothetical protein